MSHYENLKRRSLRIVDPYTCSWALLFFTFIVIPKSGVSYTVSICSWEDSDTVAGQLRALQESAYQEFLASLPVLVGVGMMLVLAMPPLYRKLSANRPLHFRYLFFAAGVGAVLVAFFAYPGVSWLLRVGAILGGVLVAFVGVWIFRFVNRIKNSRLGHKTDSAA